MHKLQKMTKFTGGGKLAILLAASAAFAPVADAATDLTWPTDKVGGLEASPYDIYDGSYWGLSGHPSNSYHLNFDVSEYTWFTNSASTVICDNMNLRSGDFAFLGPLNAHLFSGNAEATGYTNKTVSVLKKGNWTLQWIFLIGKHSGAKTAFTNETGSIAVWGEDNDSALKTTHIGDGANSEVDVYSKADAWNMYSGLRVGAGENSVVNMEKVAGDWQVVCKCKDSAQRYLDLGYGKNSTVTFKSQAGKLTVGDSSHLGRETILGRGEGSTVTVEKEDGAWTHYGAIRIGYGKNSTSRFYHRGGSLVIAQGYGIQMGSDSSGVSSLFEISGGAVTNTIFAIGIADNGQAGSESKFVVKGDGEYYSTVHINLGYKSSGCLNIEDNGRATASAVTFCGDSGCGAGEDCYMNLDGGSLTTGYITYGGGSANATIRFNGGTLRALADDTTLIQANDNLTVTVGANGGTIDTDGKSVTIDEPFLEDGTSTGGGMTFTGGGTATVAAVSHTYTGATTVESGTTLSATGAAFAGTLVVETGAALAAPEIPEGKKYTTVLTAAGFSGIENLEKDESGNRFFVAGNQLRYGVRPGLSILVR